MKRQEDAVLAKLRREPGSTVSNPDVGFDPDGFAYLCITWELGIMMIGQVEWVYVVTNHLPVVPVFIELLQKILWDETVDFSQSLSLTREIEGLPVVIGEN